MITNLLEMSGQRKQAASLASIVQEWKSAYKEFPTEETKNVHNSLCDVLEDLNLWLLENEGEARIVNSQNSQNSQYAIGPIQKTWQRLS